MRFRTLLLLVFIVLLEIYFIASRLGVPIDVIVQFATFIALIFPLYSWEKERLHNRYALVDEVRVWADHFYYMTKHFQQVPPNQITGDEVVGIQGLATETADHLAEALARCVNIIGSDSDLARQAYDFILSVRKFARDGSLSLPGNVGKFLFDLEKLQPIAIEIGWKASAETESRFKLRYAVPRHLLQQLVMAVLAVCSFVLLLLYLNAIMEALREAIIFLERHLTI